MITEAGIIVIWITVTGSVEIVIVVTVVAVRVLSEIIIVVGGVIVEIIAVVIGVTAAVAVVVVIGKGIRLIPLVALSVTVPILPNHVSCSISAEVLAPVFVPISSLLARGPRRSSGESDLVRVQCNRILCGFHVVRFVTPL